MAAVSYSNRTFVTTPTTGTGTITLGPATPGYRGASALVDGTSYNYSIVDGANWEDGFGIFTASGATLTRNVYDSSASNAAISLSGSATVIVGHTLASDLTAANVATWPFFKSAWAGNYTINSGNFQTLPGTAVTDTHGGWVAASNVYTIPVTATYQIQAKYRLADQNINGYSLGIGIDAYNGDTADFSWWQGVNSRQGVMNYRTDVWAAGQQIRLFGYCDGFTGSLTQTALVIYRIR